MNMSSPSSPTSSSSSSIIRSLLKEKVKEIRLFANESLGITGTSDDLEILFDIVKSQLERTREYYRPVPLDSISSLVADLIRLRQNVPAATDVSSSTNEKTEQGKEYVNLLTSAIQKATSLVQLCKPSTKGLFSFIDYLRSTIHDERSGDIHIMILEALRNALSNDSPDYVKFPGDENSFAQFSSSRIAFTQTYTLTLWMMIEGSAEMSSSDATLVVPSSSLPLPPHIGNKMTSSPTMSTSLPSRKIVSSYLELFEVKGSHLNIRCGIMRGKNDRNNGNSGSPRDDNDDDDGYEGIWTVRIETNEGRKKQVGTIFLSPQKWHLVAFRHSRGDNMFSIFVDGKLEVEFDVLFPFKTEYSSGECQWTVGRYFRGRISSISMYAENLSPDVLKLLSDLGPHMHSTDCVLSFPSTSRDSCYNELGSVMAKGPMANKLSSTPPVFSITGSHFMSVATLPLMSSGSINVESIEMSANMHYDVQNKPSITGSCKVINNENWAAKFQNLGGTSVHMYLLWNYCGQFNHASNVHDLRLCIQEVLLLLSRVIRSSFDVREQFLQTHGFHLVCLCLKRLQSSSPPNDIMPLDDRLVDICFELGRSIGIDAFSGDGVAAILQGLVFDYKLWEKSTFRTRAHLLESMLIFLSSIAEHFHSCIGVQYTIDAVKYLLMDNESSSSSSSSSSLTADKSRCCIACEKLLAIALEEAVLHHRSKSASSVHMFRDFDLVLACIEEDEDMTLKEIMLRFLNASKFTFPDLLLSSLVSARFVETAGLALLINNEHSIVVRRSALQLVVWTLYNDLRELPGNIARHRAANAKVLSETKLMLNESQQHTLNQQQHMEIIALKSMIKPALKAWNNIQMISSSLRSVCASNLHHNMKGSPTASDPHNTNISSRVPPIYDFFMEDGPLGHDSMWLMLPMLPFVLSECDVYSCQRLLMDFSVLLKTDESQCEVLCTLPDSLWVPVFVDIIVVSLNFGSVDEENKLATNCIELSIDALVSILEKRARYYCQNSLGGFTSLSALLDSIQNNVYYTENTMQTDLAPRLLRRCISIFIQRISRLRDGQWTHAVLDGIGKIMKFLEDKELCVPLHESDEILIAKLANSMNIEVHEKGEAVSHGKCNFVNPEQPHLISFLIDLMGSLRRRCKVDMEGHERLATQTVLKILLKSIQYYNFTDHKSLLSRINDEIYSGVIYLSNKWACFNKDGYKTVVYRVLHTLGKLTKDEGLSEEIKGFFVLLAKNIVNFLYESHINSKFDSKHGQLDTEGYVNHVSTCLGLENNETGDLSSIFSVVDEDNVSLPASSRGIHPDTAAYIAGAQGVEFIKREEISKWINLRLGILSDRIETEKLRVAAVEEAVDSSCLATYRFWNLHARKLEMEIFASEKPCEWKLGISHEGPMPFRTRLVVKPKYIDETKPHKALNLSSPSGSSRPRSVDDEDFQVIESEDVLFELKKLSDGGHILDITSADNTDIDSDQNGTASSIFSSSAQFRGPSQAKEQTWGVVDIDGSEDGGFGVVGLENVSSVPDYQNGGTSMDKAVSVDKSSTSAVKNSTYNSGVKPATVDDYSYMQESSSINMESFRLSKSIDTSPCHVGERRMEASKILHQSEAVMITPSGNYFGSISVTKTDLYFISLYDIEACKAVADLASVNLVGKKRHKRRRWILNTVCGIYRRRYRLRETACEIFFSRGKHRSVFFSFGSSKSDVTLRNNFLQCLMQFSPRSAFRHKPSMSPSLLVSEYGVQEKWISGELSNFDYLQALNTLSGRTLNDLCQYPIFPWVLQDYTSSKLDLNDEKIYRDLSKPMGALNPERLEQYIERYKNFGNDQGVPPFMYGSHYSTMVGVVLHYLVRLQPFADLHRNVQNGSFDLPDRLFSSIAETWNHNYSMLSEVKELTPEWYALPDFLRNVNKFPFGARQDGNSVDDVELPPWASSPEEFIRIHRAALESDYVSSHLHEWIDLIFGYKQSGPNAVKANNVFYYLTYYGAVDIDKIEEEAVKKAMEIQIAHFGQCPVQLFKSPHPQKLRNCIPRPIRKCFPADSNTFCTPSSTEERTVYDASCGRIPRNNAVKVVKINILMEKLLLLSETGVLESFSYGVSNETKNMLKEVQQIQRNKSTPQIGTILDGEIVIDNENSRTSSRTSMSSSPVDPSPSIPSMTPSSQSSSWSNSASITSTASSTNVLKFKDIEGYKQVSSLIQVTRDSYEFDENGPPRVPMDLYRLQNTDSVDYSDGLVSTKNFLLGHRVLTYLFGGSVVLSAGWINGNISIRELNVNAMRIVNGGDFHAHKSPVVCVASDVIKEDYQEVITSIDAAGKVMIWTISRKKRDRRLVISRRPHRLFIMPPNSVDDDNCLDTYVSSISWQMGILCVANKEEIHVFSIERDEKIRVIALSETALAGCLPEDIFQIEYIALSNSNGVIIVCGSNRTAAAATSNPNSTIASFALGGNLSSLIQLHSIATICKCPGNGDAVVVGFFDGSVYFFESDSLNSIFVFTPHKDYNYCEYKTQIVTNSLEDVNFPGDSVGDSGATGDTSVGSDDREVGRHAVLDICFGPNPLFPSLFATASISGAVYVKALPDFIAWERIRTPSVMEKIANAPLQAFRGTIQHAQTSLADTAFNLKSLASDAMEEATELVKRFGAKSKLFSSVFSNSSGSNK